MDPVVDVMAGVFFVLAALLLVGGAIVKCLDAYAQESPQQRAWRRAGLPNIEK